jgi:multidrug transporter EmrE-like cation transporter
MSYLYLFLAIAAETSAGVLMKYSDGLTRIIPTAFMLILYALSISMASLAVRGLNTSIVYAIWSAVGLIAVTILGYFLFNEPMSWLKVLFTGLIIIGAVGLNLNGVSK